MAWTLTDDLGDFAAAAGDFLQSRSVQHTIQLAAIQTLRARGSSAFGQVPPLFGWWRPEAGAVLSAFLHTPPYPALLTRLPPDSARPLAEQLAPRSRQLPGVNAEQGDATAFVLEAGAEHVVLFTDLANPTSNALYQRLGYRPVEDRVELSFRR